MTLAMSGATPSDAGLASGLVNTTIQVGGAIGLAVLATLATERTDSLIADGESTAAALNSGYHLAYLIGAVLIGVAIVVALAVIRPQQAPAGAEAAREHESAGAPPRILGSRVEPLDKRRRGAPASAAGNSGNPGWRDGAPHRKESNMTVAIIVIVVVALIAIALIVAANRRRNEQQLEDRRHVAAGHREEAESRQLSADRESAAAEEQAARARREAAEAEERAREAERERETATAHQRHAEEIDPDADRDDATPAEGERTTPAEEPPREQTPR